MAESTAQTRAPTFLEQVIAANPGDPLLDRCIQCGTCGGSCPSSADMDYTPRALFAMVFAGMKDEVLKSKAPWFCVSCYYCMVRCPQDIHVTDVMYTLKRMSLHARAQGSFSAEGAPGFSQSFIFFVENFGRSFELGLATRYAVLHPKELIKLAPLGWGMMSKSRLDIIPKKIKHANQLKAILNKAKELESEHWKKLEGESL